MPGSCWPCSTSASCENQPSSHGQCISISALPTADLVIDAVYEGGTKGNTADDVLGKLIPGAGNQGGFRAVGSWDAPRLAIYICET
jgi:hypothetical protein